MKSGNSGFGPQKQPYMRMDCEKSTLCPQKQPCMRMKVEQTSFRWLINIVYWSDIRKVCISLYTQTISPLNRLQISTDEKNIPFFPGLYIMLQAHSVMLQAHSVMLQAHSVMLQAHSAMLRARPRQASIKNYIGRSIVPATMFEFFAASAGTGIVAARLMCENRVMRGRRSAGSTGPAGTAGLSGFGKCYRHVSFQRPSWNIVLVIHKQFHGVLQDLEVIEHEPFG